MTGRVHNMTWGSDEKKIGIELPSGKGHMVQDQSMGERSGVRCPSSVRTVRRKKAATGNTRLVERAQGGILGWVGYYGVVQHLVGRDGRASNA